MRVFLALFLSLFGLAPLLVAQLGTPPGDDPPEGGGDPPDPPGDAAAALSARIAELEAQVATSAEEAAALREQHAAELTVAQAAAELARAEALAAHEPIAALEARHLEAHRRALLAESGLAGSELAKLVTGSTPEELDASTATVKTAYENALEQARTAAAASVPLGASGSVTGDDPGKMRPLDKLKNAFSSNGHS